jgi:hypothetical protein
MAHVNWVESLERSSDPKEIELQINSLQKRYRFWLAISFAVLSAGLAVIVIAGSSNQTSMILGLFVAASGLALALSTKLQAGISLSMYRILLAVLKH